MASQYDTRQPLPLQTVNSTSEAQARYEERLDWLAREALLAALDSRSAIQAELARVESNHHLWIQSPASCH